MKRFKKILITAIMGFATLGSLATFTVANTAQANASTLRPATRRYHKVRRLAFKQLGKRYVFGATGSKTFDCSGFTQYIYRRAAHKYIPRTAQQQFNQERHIRVRHLRRGNLVFFGRNRRNIEHVGMYIGGGKMIDAQLRGVVVEKIHAPWWHVVAAARVR